MKQNLLLIFVPIFFLLITKTAVSQHYTTPDDATTYINLPVTIDVRSNDSWPYNYQTIQHQGQGALLFPPEHGEIQITGPYIVYFPDTDFQGDDMFCYAIVDNQNPGAILDTAVVNVSVLQDNETSFHVRVSTTPSIDCADTGDFYAIIYNGTSPYLYQINGSAVQTTNYNSLMFENFAPLPGNIIVTDANSETITNNFIFPSNSGIICIYNATGGTTIPWQCTGAASFNVYNGTPPFTVSVSNILDPMQPIILNWENGTSESRLAFMENLCYGFYNVVVTDAHYLQVQSSFMIDSLQNYPNSISQTDTCLTIMAYNSANVTDVYTDAEGTWVHWVITLTNEEIVELDVLYSIPSPGTYGFTLYINCADYKTTLVLNSIFTVSSDDLIYNGVPVSNIENQISIFPNPVSDNLNLQINSLLETSSNIRIYDITGKEYYNENTVLAQNNNSLSINTSEYPSGLYILILSYENETHSLRFVK